MEAMCAALPVICLDTSGMSIMTDESTAIRIVPTSRGAIEQGIAEGLAALCASRELRERLGQAGRARMQDMFLWDRKGEELSRTLFGEDIVAEGRNVSQELTDDRLLPSS
jgi:glycosyltransferase involved in cell wall biosynthesis